MVLSKGAKIGLWIGGSALVIGVGYLLYKKYNKQTPIEEKKALKDVFDNLNFETNKDVIKADSFSYLDELADVLSQEPEWKIKIVGHTDNVGKDEFNMDLSKRRANSVKKYLVEKGIEDTRIETDGMGKTKPIASNDTKEGKEKNRRVEFTITKPDNSTITTTV